MKHHPGLEQYIDSLNPETCHQVQFLLQQKETRMLVSHPPWNKGMKVEHEKLNSHLTTSSHNPLLQCLLDAWVPTWKGKGHACTHLANRLIMQYTLQDLNPPGTPEIHLKSRKHAGIPIKKTTLAHHLRWLEENNDVDQILWINPSICVKKN